MELTEQERDFLEKYKQLEILDKLRVQERMDEMLERQHREKKKDFKVVRDDRTQNYLQNLE